MMRKLNEVLNTAAFNQESQLVFSFLGTCLFIAIDLVFYAQDIAIVSQYANLILLILAKMSMLSSLICVIHWQLLKKPFYLHEVQRYLQTDSIWHQRLANPAWALAFGYVYALLSHLPAFLGLQFLQNNIILFILNGLVLFLFFIYGYKRIFRQILDVLGRIMLLPEIGNTGLTSGWSLRFKKPWLKWALMALGLIALLRQPSLLMFFLAFPVGVALSMSLGIALVLLFWMVTLCLPIVLTHRNEDVLKSLIPGSEHIIQAGVQGGRSLLHTLRPAAWLVGGYLLLISAFPKPYPQMGEQYSRSILGSARRVVVPGGEQRRLLCHAGKL